MLNLLNRLSDRIARPWLCSVLWLAAAGCASRPAPDIEPPPLVYHGQVPEVTAVDPLELTDDMQRFVQRNVPDNRSARMLPG